MVELAAGLRSGGQTVNLRGPSTEILRAMGLLESCRARRVPQRGIAWIDEFGELLATMPVEAFDGQGFVSKDELLRSDLAAVIHDAGGSAMTYRFGETVQRLETSVDGVKVKFSRGDTNVFDLVVGADGTHSRVRSLVFGPENRFRRPLGLAHAWFTLRETAATPALDGWFTVQNAPGSRVVEARPRQPGEQEIGFSFAADELPDRRDREAQLTMLEQTFRGVGGRSRELLDAAQTADDFALDTFDQIHIDRWSEGRIVLLGDSAWCSSPLSGLGTSLALQGAAALASELAIVSSGEAVECAAIRYEAAMRRRVESEQKLLPGRVRMYAPRTTLGIRASAALMHMMQARPIARAVVHLAPAQQAGSAP